MMKLAVVLAAVSVAACLAAANPILTVAQFTDTIFCQARSRNTSYDVVTGTCRAGNATQGPTAVICDPTLRPTAVVYQYSDPACTVPVGSQTIPCDVCTGQNTVAACIQENGAESIEVLQCDKTAAPNTCSGVCAPAFNIKAGGCYPSTDKATGQVTGYFQYSGATLSTFVAFLQFAKFDAQCQKQPESVKMMPTDHCEDGLEFACKYSEQRNATASVSRLVALRHKGRPKRCQKRVPPRNSAKIVQKVLQRKIDEPVGDWLRTDGKNNKSHRNIVSSSFFSKTRPAQRRR